MAKKIYTATGPNGETFTRSTQSRTYTHMVAGKRNAAFDRERARKQFDNDLREFQQHQQWAAEGYEPSSWMVGKLHWDSAKYPNQTLAEVFREEGKQSAIAWLADKPSTAAEYAAAELDRLLSAIEADEKAGGVYDRFTVDFGWCGRPDLAVKLQASSRSAHYAEVTVLEAVQTK